jgi:hypothetical protein
MTDNVTPFRNIRFENLDRGGRQVRWHAEVAMAIRAAIEPLSQKAPPGESIEDASCDKGPRSVGLILPRRPGRYRKNLGGQELRADQGQQKLK